MPLPPRKSDGSLNPEIERLLYQLKVAREDGLGLIDGLSDEQANWSPGAGKWSMAQCFDHLNVTNRLFVQQFRAGVAEARQRGILGGGPYSYGFLSRWFLRQTEPPVKRRFSAPKPFQPGPKRPIVEIRNEWVRLHDELDEIFRSASGVDLARMRITSPAASFIKYSLGIGFWIQTAHDRRHVWQARQVRNLDGFPVGVTATA
ncbi:MAG: DinB family protein [Bryobacteraceae bacterium]